MNRFNVRKVAVLGAGVMGAQIAAHLVNVRVPVVLFDLPAKEGPKNGIVTQGGRRPEEAEARAARRARGRRADRAGQLRGAPRPAAASATWSSRRSPSAWTGSSTSTRRSRRRSRRTRSSLATPRACRSPSCREALPEEIKPRFCGIHFFNPPRYMALVELIADADHRARDPRPARGLRDHARSARAWCAPRTRRTSSPTASASPACWRR